MRNLIIILTIILSLSGVQRIFAQEEEIEMTAPGCYEIQNDTTGPIAIPFTMHNGKPLMKLRINGKDASLMIDNGRLWDEIWLFGSPLVDTLNLISMDEGNIGGAGKGDSTSAYTSSNLTLQFDDIIFYEQPVIVSPAAAGFARMFPGVDGQLCNTFFKHFIVEFDFIKNLIILHDPESFEYTGIGSVLDMQENTSGAYSIPFHFEMVDGTVYNDRVDIDFGGIYPLKVALGNTHNIQLPAEVTETYSYGAQGKCTEYRGTIKSMTIGDYTFENPNIVFGDEKTSRIHPENLGVVGLPLFMKFNIIFDYINNKLYIEPNENYDKPLN